MQKITKREMFTMIMAKVADDEAMVSFIEHEIELLDKKASNKKASKTQEANVGIKEIIVSALAEIGSGTVTDIQNANAELGELSNQKVSALLRQLITEGLVEKSTDKKKSIFTLVK